MGKVLTIKQFSQKYNVSEDSLYRGHRQKSLPWILKVPHFGLRCDMDAFFEWIGKQAEAKTLGDGLRGAHGDLHRREALVGKAFIGEMEEKSGEIKKAARQKDGVLVANASVSVVLVERASIEAPTLVVLHGPQLSPQGQVNTLEKAGEAEGPWSLVLLVAGQGEVIGRAEIPRGGGA